MLSASSQNWLPEDEMIDCESSDVKPILLPSDAHHFGYAVFGADLHLCEVSPLFESWVGDFEMGVRLDEVLPIFAGVESTLAEIMGAGLPYWYLQNVVHSQAGHGYQRFLNILVLPYRQGDGLFVTIRDVTAEEVTTRWIVQQRNMSWLQFGKGGSGGLKDSEGNDPGSPAMERETVLLQALVRELRISTMAAVGQCLHLMRQSSTWEEFLVTKMVLASSLRVDGAIAAMLSGGPTMLGIDAGVPHDLPALVQDVASDFQSWRATNELEIEFSVEQVPSVIGFGSVLREALVLLLVDGIHYGAGGGRIDVAVINHLQGVLVKLSSNGSVQSSDIESRDFQSYWRDGDMSDTTRAMAAGLHLMNAIAGMHGGRFSLDHADEGGITFLLWFPSGEDLHQTSGIGEDITTPQLDAPTLLDVCSRLNLMFLLANEELVVQYASPTLETLLDRALVGRVFTEALPAFAGVDEELNRIVLRQEEIWRIRGIQLAESEQSLYDVSLMPRHDGAGLVLAAQRTFMQAAVEQVLRQQRNELSISFDKLAEQAAALRIANDRLAGLDQERRALLNLLTHDISSSVSVIAGYSERLSEELMLSVSAEDQTALTAIQDSALHMTDLLKSVMVLDRIEAKLRNINWQRLSLSDLVRDVIAMWQSRIIAQEIQLVVHTEGDVHDIDADVELLGEAIQVLLVRILDMATTDSNVNVRLFNWDRWSVIRFEQVPAKVTPSTPSSRQKTRFRSTMKPDLQLALARLIVEGHGGHLSIEQGGSKGSAISLWLLHESDRGSDKGDIASENMDSGSDLLIVAQGRILIHRTAPQVWLDKEPVSLTASEYRLLLCLCENVDQAVSHEQITMAIWRREDSDSTRRLRVLVSRLRPKLNVDENGPQYLHTIRGFGYMMVS